MESYNCFLEFVKRSNAVSPTVALETATALQVNALYAALQCFIQYPISIDLFFCIHFFSSSIFGFKNC